MPALYASDYVVPSSAVAGLDVQVTRYQPPQSAHHPTRHNQIRLSLLFTHGVSFCKELWLPTIEFLFNLQNTSHNPLPFVILDAWTIDFPNHGRSAVLNESKLCSRPNGISAYESARAVQDFLAAGLAPGDKLVAIGHSAGSCVLPLATVGNQGDILPFASLILVEPAMMAPAVLRAVTQTHAGKAAFEQLLSMARTRRDVWPSRTAARTWMSTHLPWKRWTPRCIDLFVENALCDLPNSTYPDKPKGAVTLCCTRAQEVAGYTYIQDGVDCLNRLKYLCAAIPTHCIFGEQIDAISKETQEAIIHPRSGRAFATITRVPNAGHLVVQENPEGLAQAIWAVLRHDFDVNPLSGGPSSGGSRPGGSQSRL